MTAASVIQLRLSDLTLFCRNLSESVRFVLSLSVSTLICRNRAKSVPVYLILQLGP